MQITATVQSGNKTKTVPGESGETLRALLQRAEVGFAFPCGGRGTCGKCRVTAAGALRAPSAEERAFLGEKALAGGARLACRARAEGDVAISLPEGAQTDSVPEKAAAVRLPRSTEFGVAADIGTTTVAVYFYDLSTGKRLYAAGAFNPQRVWGADVLARVLACMEDPAAPARLQKSVVGALNGLVADFCSGTGLAVQNLRRAVFAGNTAMLHLAAGADSRGLAAAPFTPATLFGEALGAEAFGFAMAPGGQVIFTPCVSAFVGGDLTAGLLACGLDEPADEPALLVDIGTNGEMALRCEGRLLCCSTAAGPAFEGAHIRYGCGASAGAISAVTIHDGALHIETVDGARPVGICGSGLIDAVAAMLSLGALQQSGRIAPPKACRTPDAARRVTMLDGAPAFLLDEESGVAITQKDIREVQLAKAAVAAGIESLLHAAGISVGKVGRFVLAGGFGAHISPDNARRIGLLPAWAGTVETAGNAAGEGAALILLDPSKNLPRAVSAARRCETLDLNEDAFFQRRFIGNMIFPHVGKT